MTQENEGEGTPNPEALRLLETLDLEARVQERVWRHRDGTPLTDDEQHVAESINRVDLLAYKAIVERRREEA